MFLDSIPQVVNISFDLFMYIPSITTTKMCIGINSDLTSMRVTNRVLKLHANVVIFRRGSVVGLKFAIYGLINHFVRLLPFPSNLIRRCGSLEEKHCHSTQKMNPICISRDCMNVVRYNIENSPDM